MTLSQRKEVLFDDMLASLWSEAYAEIVSMVREAQLVDKELFLQGNAYIVGVMVDSNGCLEFINKNGVKDNAENYDDEWMYSVYKMVYHSLFN
jgi:hypothetical protein